MTDEQTPPTSTGPSIKKDGPPFVLGICGGIILGALIDNMAIGLLVGFAVAFGVIRFGRRSS